MTSTTNSMTSTPKTTSKNGVHNTTIRGQTYPIDGMRDPIMQTQDSKAQMNSSILPALLMVKIDL